MHVRTLLCEVASMPMFQLEYNKRAGNLPSFIIHSFVHSFIRSHPLSLSLSLTSIGDKSKND